MYIFFDANLNQKLADQIDTAVRFFLSRLLPEDKISTLSLDIDFNSKQSELGILVPEDELIDDELDEPSPYPRNFFLTLRYKKKDLIETLAHECVHIKQFVMGELDRSYCLRKQGDNIVMETETWWLGQKWEPREGEDPSYDSPYEQEAYGREVGLTHQYRRKFG